MENKLINQYLENNRVAKIGNQYEDIIVKDWREFVEFLYSNSYIVYEILWWEYLPINGRKKQGISGGGIRDIQRPDYMWAETCIEESFSEGTTKKDIVGYIESIIEEYDQKSLIPSFSIKSILSYL